MDQKAVVCNDTPINQPQAMGNTSAHRGHAFPTSHRQSHIHAAGNYIHIGMQTHAHPYQCVLTPIGIHSHIQAQLHYCRTVM